MCHLTIDSGDRSYAFRDLALAELDDFDAIDGVRSIAVDTAGSKWLAASNGRLG